MLCVVLGTRNVMVNDLSKVPVFSHSEFGPCWNPKDGTKIWGRWVLLNGRKERGKKVTPCSLIHISGLTH